MNTKKKKKSSQIGLDLNQYRMTEEDKKNIVTSRQLQELKDYKRNQAMRQRIEKEREYEKLFKVNEDYLNEVIKDISITFNSLSQSDFNKIFESIVKKYFEDNGIEVDGKKKVKVLRRVINYQKYWNLYIKLGGLNLKETKIMGIPNLKTSRKVDWKSEKKLPKIMVTQKVAQGRKKINDNELEKYKLDYLFYTTDNDIELKPINLIRSDKKYTYHNQLDFTTVSNIKNTVKIVNVKSRVGHSNIYCRNLEKTMPCCPITNISDIKFLRHSHIKPWSLSDDSEKLDGYNGLILEYGYDMLFDKGWISFENDGKLLISPKIPKELLKVYGQLCLFL